jgi:hypothetical protein
VSTQTARGLEDLKAVISQINKIVLLIVMPLIASCAISVNTTDHQFTELKKTVYVSSHYRGDEARFINQIVAVLEKHDFEITRIDPYAAYDLEWSYVGSTAEIGLRQGRDTIVQINAGSYKWVIPGYPHTHEVADRAIEQFDQALGQMLNDETL